MMPVVKILGDSMKLPMVSKKKDLRFATLVNKSVAPLAFQVP